MQILLEFKPILKERIWGGGYLSNLYCSEVENEKIGEAWLVSGHHEGSTYVTNGTMKGRKLEDIYADHPSLFGAKKHEKFPLLLKYLDAQDDLSIQVHPDDNVAKIKHNEFGKTECWYILDAQENSEIIYGHHAQNKDELVRNIKDESWQTLFNRKKVKKGDFIFIPAGTVHGIGAGIKLIEVQQTSNITYRVYDYDRVDGSGSKRQLHISDAIDAIKFNNEQLPKSSLHRLDGNLIKRLIEIDKFTVDILDIKESIKINQEHQYTLLYILEGNNVIVKGINTNLKMNFGYIMTSEVSSFELLGTGKIMLIRENNHLMEVTYGK